MSDEQIHSLLRGHQALAHAFCNVRPTKELLASAYEACRKAGVQVG